ncbi:MAG: ABC transporter ATP-binding protein [Paraclostridium sp.]
MTNIINLVNITRKFNNAVALDSVTFNIDKGDFIGLVGPNGAGKTTLIKILCGLLAPSSFDTMNVLGFNPNSNSNEFKQKIGLVLDSSQLYFNLTAYENLKYTCDLYGIRNSKSKIDKYLELVDLLPHKKKLVGAFSTGMKQRLNIARALITGAELLILDEPTSGLDPASALSIHNLLHNIKSSGVTIILCTHNMNEVDNLCDYVLFINKGKIVANDSPNKLKSKFSEYIYTFSTNEEDINNLRSELENNNISKYIIKKVQDNWEIVVFEKMNIEEMKLENIIYSKKNINLEDIFIYIVQEESYAI